MPEPSRGRRPRLSVREIVVSLDEPLHRHEFTRAAAHDAAGVPTDDDKIVVVASQGGRSEDPQWYRNVVADPDVTDQVGRDRTRMRARTATDEERAELWPRLLDLYGDYASYQSWTERVIPVVICEPQQG